MSDSAINSSDDQNVTSQVRTPLALILKGGGVKGIAFVGAVKVLERYGYCFDAYVGTSAGAITAVALAGGYTGQELEVEMLKFDFNTLVDDIGPFRRLIRLMLKGYINSGDQVSEWVEQLLKIKIKSDVAGKRIPLSELRRRAVVFASNVSGGAVEFDSRGRRSEYSAAVAVRHSSAIPGFFRPGIFEDEPIYDGGALNNLPVNAFLSSNSHYDFIALDLMQEKVSERRPFWMHLPAMRIFASSVRLVLSQQEQNLYERHANNIIPVPCFGIRTTDFDLRKDQKELLILSGEVAALQFLAEKRPIVNVPASELIHAGKRLDELRPKSESTRRSPGGVLLKGCIAILCLSFALVAASFFSTREVKADGRTSVIVDTAVKASFSSFRDPVRYYVSLHDNSPYVNDFLVRDTANKYLFYDAYVDYTRTPPWPADNLLVAVVTKPSSYSGWVRSPEVVYREVIGVDAADRFKLAAFEQQLEQASAQIDKLNALRRLIRIELQVDGSTVPLVSFTKEPFGYVLGFTNPLRSSTKKSARYEFRTQTFQPRTLRAFPYIVSELFKHMDYKLDYSDANIADADYFSAFLYDPKSEVLVAHDDSGKMLSARSQNNNWVLPGGGVVLFWR
jgi:predicted acylesterase/phospholipase RssA